MMLRRCLTIGIAISTFILLLALSVCADEYELQYKVLDLNKERIYISGQSPRPTTRPQERLSAEPKYRTKTPIYITATFGNKSDNKYTIALDESKGTGRGYDLLYVDRNNNEDLTDDPPITGNLRQSGSSTTGNFAPLEVMVDYSDRTVPYYFSIEYRRYGNQRIQRGTENIRNMYVRLQTRGYYTDDVRFGEKKYRIAVVDYNGNGLLNEYFKPRTDIRSERLYADGDQILVDVDGNGKFEAEYYDFKEMFPYAKYLNVDGKWYSLLIADHGGKIEVQIPELKLGMVKLPNQPGSFTLELVSSNGILKFQAKGQTVQVPVDSYQLYAHNTLVNGSSGSWQYNAQGTKSGKKFEVTENSVLTLQFGAPILVNVSYSNQGRQQTNPKAGDTLRLSLTFSGQGGENYTNITKNGRRPPAPNFKVVDETGKALTTGTFKYG